MTEEVARIRGFIEGLSRMNARTKTLFRRDDSLQDLREMAICAEGVEYVLKEILYFINCLYGGKDDKQRDSGRI